MSRCNAAALDVAQLSNLDFVQAKVPSQDMLTIDLLRASWFRLCGGEIDLELVVSEYKAPSSLRDDRPKCRQAKTSHAAGTSPVTVSLTVRGLERHGTARKRRG